MRKRVPNTGWVRADAIVLLGEVKAVVVGTGDTSLLADFSGCVGPRTTRRYAERRLSDGGLSSFVRSGNLLWVVTP